MSWYPNKTLYRRLSSISKQPIISVYPDSWDGPVVRHDEWFDEAFRAPSLGYRAGVPFFEQLRELQKIAPLVSLLSSRQENAEYCHDCEGLKDCYMVFDSLNCRNVLYSARIYDSNDCVDAYWIMKSELIYDSTYLFSCFNCKFCFHCQEASDSAFLFDCRNCQHCFMCANLRNKSYCVRNKQLTRSEYEEFCKTVSYRDYRQVLGLRSEFRAMLNAAIWPPAFLGNVEACSGNYLKNCKDCSATFESFELRDCSDSFQCAMGKDIHNSFMCNDRVELCRNCVATGIQSYNTRACAFTWHSQNMEFCYLCLDCSNCFGCWGLKNKHYCILNQECSEAEYLKLAAALRQELEGHEFFPDELNPFHFEDTIAADFFAADNIDLFQAELSAAQGGCSQSDRIKTCLISAKQFKLVDQECEFYATHALCPPEVSPRIRYQQRIQMMDTSFTAQPIRVGDETIVSYFKRPEQKQIVSSAEYLRTLY